MLLFQQAAGVTLGTALKFRTVVLCCIELHCVELCCVGHAGAQPSRTNISGGKDVPKIFPFASSWAAGNQPESIPLFPGLWGGQITASEEHPGPDFPHPVCSHLSK